MKVLAPPRPAVLPVCLPAEHSPVRGGWVVKRCCDYGDGGVLLCDSHPRSALSLSLSLCRVFSLAPPRVRVFANKADCGTIQILLELLTDCANIRQSLP